MAIEKMKRRDFLKKLGIVCGAAVACPTELLKNKLKPDLWMQGKDGSYIVGIDRAIKGESRTVIMYSEFATERDMKVPWKAFYKNYSYSQKHKDQLLKELEKQFWNTKFQSPLMP